MSGAAVALPQSRHPRGVGLGLLKDDRLARLAARGNKQAFAEIYERYHQALYRYCLSILRNPEDASDALQSTIAKALQALQGEQREIALKPWLYRIAHNEAISIVRRRRDHASIENAELLAGPALDSDLATRERLRELVTDLAELTERQRGALIMRELNGLEYAEIADVFSISPAAAKQTVYEARTALHERAEGREMECGEIRRALSEGDRRVTRGRRIRAHVRDCAHCRDFEVLMRERPAQLAALAPPLAAPLAASILAGAVGTGAGSGGGGVLAALTGGAVTDAGTKTLAIGAATLVAGAGVIGVVRGGLPAVPDEGAPRIGAPPAQGGAERSAPGERHGRHQRHTQRRDSGGRDARGGAGERRASQQGANGHMDSKRFRQSTLVPPDSERSNFLPPASEYVTPQTRPTSGMPAPVDHNGRRVIRLGETIQEVAPETPVPLPYADLDDGRIPDIEMPRR